eukprot:scaffold6009_cov31-Phaeocystis_antarctica.AAC.2
MVCPYRGSLVDAGSGTWRSELRPSRNCASRSCSSSRSRLIEVLSRGGRESKWNGRGIVIPRGRSRGADAGRCRRATAAAAGS